MVCVEPNGLVGAVDGRGYWVGEELFLIGASVGWWAFLSANTCDAQLARVVPGTSHFG